MTLGTTVVSVSMLAAALAFGATHAHVEDGKEQWTGIGAAGTAAFGIAFLGEPRDLGRLLCIALIVAGVVGLKLVSSPAE